MSQTFPQAHRRPRRSPRSQITPSVHQSFAAENSPAMGIAVAFLLALPLWTGIILVGRALW
jgi:hypothetical protein